MSEKFTCAFCMSTTCLLDHQLIQKGRAWISKGGMFHPAMEQKALDTHLPL